jgi:hypothetical protein
MGGWINENSVTGRRNRPLINRTRMDAKQDKIKKRILGARAPRMFEA